jgi:hypothetical protein
MMTNSQASTVLGSRSSVIRAMTTPPMATMISA